MKKLNLRILLILSCLMISATQLVFGQEKDFNQIFRKNPLRDLATDLNQKLDRNEVDLDKSFSVTLEGYLTKEGRFDNKRTKFTKSEGDEKIVAVAKQAIESVGYSGIFVYLSDLGVEKVKIDFSQDDKNISAILTSEMLNEKRAKTVASGFNGLFQVAKLKTKDAEVPTLLNATAFQTEGKNFILNFVIPKEEAQRMIKNELQKAKEKSYSN